MSAVRSDAVSPEPSGAVSGHKMTIERSLPEPFDLDLVLRAVQSSSFGTPYSVVGPETVRRVLHFADQPVAVDFTFSRTERQLRATVVSGAVPATADLTRLTTHLWGLSDDLAACYEALVQDPLLEPLLSRFRGLRLIRAADLYEALISAILGQQISVASAQSVRRRLMAGLGDRLRVDGAEFVGYPSPVRLLEAGPDGLQGLGITRQKSRYLLEVAERAAGGALDEDRFADLNDAEAIARLCAIPGVGRWTAEVALMYGLGRMDLFFAGDLALQVALQRLLGRSDRPGEGELRRLGERWAGWRSYAALYLLMTLKSEGND